MTTAERPRPRSCEELLEQQDGVISRRQARAAGMTEDQWQWRLDSARWQSLLPGVAVAHTSVPTARQLAWAAVLHAGADAHLSADAALVEHGVRLPAPAALHVVTARQLTAQRLARRDDRPLRAHFHRVGGLAEWVHPVRRPPVLRVAPATLHAAAWASSDRAAEWRVAAVVQQRRATAAQLRKVLAQMPRLPRRALLRDVLDDVELGAHAQSELDFLRFLRRHRLPLPDRLQRPVRRGTVRYLDAWWERQRVSAEIDGAHHRLVGAWDDDALRANDVVIVERHARILLLRFTRANLRHDAARVAAQLADALR